MLRSSDFVTCKKDVMIRVGGVYISAFEHCRKMKFRTYLLLTLISKIFMLSWLSDFAVCSTSLYILNSGVYI